MHVNTFIFDLCYDLEGNSSESVVKADIIFIFHFFTAGLHSYDIDNPYMDSSSVAQEDTQNQILDRTFLAWEDVEEDTYTLGNLCLCLYYPHKDYSNFDHLGQIFLKVIRYLMLESQDTVASEKDVDVQLEDVEAAVQFENLLQMACSKDDKANGKTFGFDTHTYCLYCISIYSKYFA